MRTDVPWCESCERSPCWPGHDQCSGCLAAGLAPCDVVPVHRVHWDLREALRQVRVKVALWEQAHPGWRLEPDYERVWENRTAPSRAVDRETAIGRKKVEARFRVVRTHPRGVRS